MANNRQHRRDRNVTCVLKILNFLITLFVMKISLKSSMSCLHVHGHLIHFDHTQFRSNVYPTRTHLPPVVNHNLDIIPTSSAKELTPSEYMVDLTNDLAYRILHYHSILNRNNFAFSPTALMSVLMAIYEGSAGKSRTELKNILQLPDNHDIIRVGYRDIHRRLRTYFFDKDNPLRGLSLNRENVTITRDYEAILMFYGYDLGIDMVSSTTMAATTSTSPITPTNLTQETEETTTETTSTTVELTTTSPKIETTKTQMTTITTTAATTQKIEDTTETPTMKTEATTEDITTTTEENVTTMKPEETKDTTSEKAAEESTSETPPATETTNETEATTTIKPESEKEEAAELITSFVAEGNSEPFLRIQKARVSRLPSAKLQAPLASRSKPKTNYLPAEKKSSRITSRNKRHLWGYKEFDSNLFVTLLNTEAHLHTPLTTGSALTGIPTYVQVSNDYEVETDPNYIVTSQASANLKQNYNTDVISHVFYLNNQQIIYTTFKVYNAVLYYKYFEHLRLSVLELELDTPEYNLIILLPDYNTDLVAAAASLRNGPKLRLMRKQLKPKWVQAIIPDFKLHGTMFLTNDLQNLGICDIFEPNRADFRPMTDEKGTYVKHIEQSINVHIRTNPINQIRRNNGAQTQPIQISVNHPFMFFIIDRDLDVAVMAGRILNPLNVRVQ